MNYATVVWDFDGVLADSRDEAWRAAVDILRLLEVDASIDSQAAFRERFAYATSFDDSTATILRAMHRVVMRQRTSRLQLFPCIELVPQLTISSEIVTSSYASGARAVLGEHARHFSTIRGRETGRKKALFETLPAKSLCITDTVSDIRLCHERGVDVVGVAWGYDEVAAITTAKPNYVVVSHDDLKSLFGELDLLRTPNA